LYVIGKTISHYEIVSKLGEGGMGEVWEAHDSRLDRTVALKLIPRHLSADPASRKRFVHEARAASSIEHANICTIHEIDETPEGETFIVMPRYQGELLSDRIAGGRMPLDDALRIVEDLAGALAEAHDHDIIHRDVKPANIIVDTNERPILLDFGLAKLTEHTKVTKTGMTVGTLSYMAPEQAAGKDVDGRADLFSLGVVLYELVTGVRPFRGDHDAAVLYSIAHEPATPLASHDPSLPAALQLIVDRALAKDPADRYASLHEMKTAVTELRRQLQSAAAPNRDGKTSGPSRPGWMQTVVAVVAVVLAALAVWKFLPRGSNDGSDERTGSVKLVVLPFENLGAPEDEYFADGITDEITSKLAVLPGLAVISRTSARKYKNTDKGLPEIGQELGVEYVLEGTIRWDKRGESEKVRITPQLISVSDDFHLWAENYEREIEEIFAVQADIASKIANALDITLLASERRTLEARPTENLDAYRAYLRGVDYIWYGDEREENVRIGIQLLERAVNLDPDFALSYAVLAEAHAFMYHYGYDRSEERLSQAKAAVDKALDLQPELPEAHLALARYYYNGYRDYDRAQEELTIAERGLPND
jgi:serine/threonine protein kinase